MRSKSQIPLYSHKDIGVIPQTEITRAILQCRLSHICSTVSVMIFLKHLLANKSRSPSQGGPLDSRSKFISSFPLSSSPHPPSFFFIVFITSLACTILLFVPFIACNLLKKIYFLYLTILK